MGCLTSRELPLYQNDSCLAESMLPQFFHAKPVMEIMEVMETCYGNTFYAHRYQGVQHIG